MPMPQGMWNRRRSKSHSASPVLESEEAAGEPVVPSAPLDQPTVESTVPTVGSGELTVGSGELTVESGELTVESTVGSGELTVGSGELTVGSTVGSGELTVESDHSAVDCDPPAFDPGAPGAEPDEPAVASSSPTDDFAYPASKSPRPVKKSDRPPVLPPAAAGSESPAAGFESPVAGADSPGVESDSPAAGADAPVDVIASEPAPPRRRRSAASVWLSALVVLGLAAAAVAGWQWGRAVDRQNTQSFDQRASTVGAAVAATLQRDTQLTATIRTLVTQDPQLTNAQLSGWLSSLAAGKPEMSGALFIQPVAADKVFYFLLQLAADPTPASAAGEPFVLTPATAQSPYCFTSLLAMRSSLESAGDTVLPPGLDWCATASAGALNRSRDTGQAVTTTLLEPNESAILGSLKSSGGHSAGGAVQTLRSLDQAFGSTVVVLEPVYAQPAPTSVSARRQSLVGWVGGLVDTAAVLTNAGGANSDLQLTLARQNPGVSSQVVASRVTGSALGLGKRIPISAGGSWLVTVRQPPVAAVHTGTFQGLVVGGVVALATLLVFLVLGALVVSRRRTMAVLDDQSGELRHANLHDSLTGLPNRALVVDRAEQMLARSRRTQLPCAALLVGLDEFKRFNEVNGHPMGDELLRAIGERLRTLLREADTVGRVGGDEFVILTDGSSLAAGPELVGERITDVLHEPFYLDGWPEPFSVTAGIGIALGPRIGAEELLRDAGVALSEAKAAGKGKYVVFGQDLPQAIESRLAFENELRSAVASKQFVLRYQPIFDIDNRTTSGVEALLRWRHPSKRVVPPDHFMPVLEATGLIVPLGRWVLHEACRQGAELHRDGYRISMSVNVSPAQLESDTIVADIEDALGASGFDPNAMVLEVAETTLLRDNINMVDRLIALKQLGVRIAIDDFGTGYSSLAFLRQFPIDILKIDRSFISSMANTRESSALIHTLVQFAKTLGLTTIAEGVEEEGQIDPLLAEQCESGQGFLYGRPLSPTQLDIFLRTHLTQDPPLWVVSPRLTTR
jgi:diguanylate cyclase (GGDEF)-like protein